MPLRAVSEHGEAQEGVQRSVGNAGFKQRMDAGPYSIEAWAIQQLGTEPFTEVNSFARLQ